ncbi:MAG TPA: alpha-ketoglutarate-dependent dioxygenase AlkB [Rhodocyclaceae bacterium]
MNQDPFLPEGLRYRNALLGLEEERLLAGRLAALPLASFDFHGYAARRRVLSFGWHYDFGSATLRRAEPLPEFLLPLRERAAAFAGIAASDLVHALITGYSPGTAIGWHRDKAVFADVIGVSLLSSCVLRFRRWAETGWQRASVALAPRSAYLLRGPARALWEHSIPPVGAPRYSITFRSLR